MVLALMPGPRPMQSHQTGHAFDIAPFPAGSRFGLDPWAAIGLVHLGVDGPDLDPQGLIGPCSSTGRPPAPGVVAAHRDPQAATQAADGKCIALLMDGLVSQSDLGESTAIAFFKMSRS